MKGRLLIALTAHDLRARYAGTGLGALWAFVSPLMTVLVYWFVYTVAFAAPSVQGEPYILWLIAGILPWFFFSDGLIGAANCFFDYRHLVCKIRFPAEKLPLVRVCAAMAVHGVLLTAAYLAICVSGIAPRLGQLWTFFWLIGGFLLILGLGRIFALLCSYVRDAGYGLQAALSLGFWITPIFWDASALRGGLRLFCDYNPVAILADGYRAALLHGALPDGRRIAAFALVTAVCLIFSTVWMKRSRPTLADRL